MNREKNQLAFKGIAAGFLNKVVTMGLPFVVRTVIIYTIGSEYLGLDSVFASVLSILSFAELGFSKTMVYSMYKPIADRDEAKLCALLNLYKQLYRIVGLVILFAGLAIMPFLRYFIHGSYPADINLYILYGIFLLNTVAGYWLFAYKESLLSAHQMYYVNSNISTVMVALTDIVQIVLLLTIKNYYAYIIILPLKTVLRNIVVAVSTKKLFPQYRAEGRVDRETARSIRKNVLAGISHRLGPAATASVDNLVVSSFSGLILASVYSNYNYILTSVAGCVSLVFGSYIAGIGNNIITETREKNFEDFKFFSFLNRVLMGWSAICILCLSQPFMWLWVGQKNGMEFMYPASVVLLLVIMYYAQGVRNIVLIYKTAAGMWYADKWKPLVTVIANAVLDIVLFPYLGVAGIILSTIFAHAVVGIPWETGVMFRQYFKMPQRQYYGALLRDILITMCIGLVSYGVCRLIPDGNISLLLLKGFVCAAVTAGFYLVIYRKNPYMKRVIKSLGKVVKVKEI